MGIKATVRWEFTPTRWKLKKKSTRTGKDIETFELSYTVGENANWCLQSGKQFSGFFQS